MKNYKYLVPIVLVVLMVASTYMYVNGASAKTSTYTAYLEDAREYEKDGILVDALDKYEEALKLNNTLDVCLEVGAALKKHGTEKELFKWAEHTVELYPEEAKAYEFLLQLYYEDEKYGDCFQLKNQIDSRKVTSKTIEKMFNEINYKYSIDYISYEEVTVFSWGYCPVKKGDLWGFVNSKGKVNVSVEYAQAGVFSGEFAAITTQDGDSYYIDAEGNKRKNVPKEVACDKLGMLCDDYIAVESNKKYKYYDTEFKKSFGEYDYASNFNLGVAAVMEKENWYLIAEEGKKINEKPYKDIVIDEKEIAFRNDRAFVNNGNGYIMVDSKGKQIGALSFEDAVIFYEDSYAAVKVKGKWGFVDSNGDMKIETQYDNALSFANGYAAVCKNGKWGYINTSNEVVIDFVFAQCKSFNEIGRAFVKEGGSWNLLNIIRYDYE